MIKKLIVFILTVVLWSGSLYQTAKHFYLEGARFGYDTAATECSLYALLEQFKGK